MDWIQVFTIIGILGSFMLWHATKVEADMKESRSRTDQLYQMFVDLLKEGKKK